MPTRDSNLDALAIKVPQVTLLFWIIKILATTLGETGGDAVTMSWLGETTPEAKAGGYLIGTAIFGVIFIAAVLVQIRAKKFHPFLYWLTIVATTTVGTTLADYCDQIARHWLHRRLGHLTDLRHWLASDLALVDREHIYRDGEYTEGRGVLLGHDHVLADARYGTRRLGRRYQRNGLYRGGRGLRWFTSGDRSSLLLHQHFTRDFILGCVHLDSPARRRRRRLSR